MIAADHAAIRNKSTTISEVFVGVTGKTFVALVEPVFENDQPSFLLSLGIPTGTISKILNRDMSHSSWLIGVTGADNKILGRTWDEDQFVGKTASDAFIKNTQGDSGIFIATTSDGVDVFDVYVRSKVTGWKIAAGLPLSLYQAPLHHTLYVLGAMIVFGLACSVAFSFGYARFLLKPVAALQALVESPSIASFKLVRSASKSLMMSRCASELLYAFEGSGSASACQGTKPPCQKCAHRNSGNCLDEIVLFPKTMRRERCPLLAPSGHCFLHCSGHCFLHCTCLLLTQSGHTAIKSALFAL